MARARQIKMKFAAVTLHLEGIDESQRAPKSSEHADAFIGSADMEKDDVLNSILLAPNRSVWVASDLSRLVAAVEAHSLKRRRNSQVYLDNLLLCCMPSRDARTQPLSLSSVSKALGVRTSIWLFLRGDARSLGDSGMATLREQFTQKLSRSVRGFEPLEYIIELPKPSVFERDHNQMCLRAYPVETF